MTEQNENKRKHLEFIQLTITRMNVNSFLVKGWLVTLVGAVFVLSQKDANTKFLWYAPIATSLFWGLDAYYLSIERRYNSLYDDVRVSHEAIDFSMKIDKYDFGRNKYLRCFFSKTLVLFYLIIFAVTIGSSIYINL